MPAADTVVLVTETEAPRAEPCSQGPVVRLLLVVGPGSTLVHAAAPPPGETVLAPLAARLTRVDVMTERDAVQAVLQPCEALVLDPGSLEHYSLSLADAVRRLEAPTIVVRDRQETQLGVLGERRVVTPAARASVSGGGAGAYDAALEAAAWFAWERRRTSGHGDVVPGRPTGPGDHG